jgi:hypothetical protein
MVDISTLVFIFWQKIAVLKVLYGKVHYHDTDSTFPA